MFKPLSSVAIALFVFVVPCLAQGPGMGSSDPIMVSLSIEVGKISKSVSTLSDRLTEFVNKVDKAPAAATSGSSLTERQQKLIAGLQMLTNAEQLLIVRQRFQIELVEKQGSSRTRLAQIDRDLLPQNIERSVTFEGGGTKTEELRETKRSALQAERNSLQGVLTQIASSLADTAESVREAQSLVIRMRRQYMPELEKEIER
jgi:hypothetical protein